MAKRQLFTEILPQFDIIHGGTYDYSKFVYVGAKTPSTIICGTHGEFQMMVYYHVRGKECPSCVIDRKFISSETKVYNFVEKAKRKHGNTYSYDSTTISSTNKASIICSIHGEFQQSTHDHLAGRGCAKCGGSYKLTTDDFIKRAKLIHGDIYDYTKTIYINSDTKVEIVCRKHGSMWQLPNGHYSGQKCELCLTDKIKEDMLIKGLGESTNPIELLRIYRGIVRRISDLSYKTHGYIINPNNHSRGIDYHLDHIVTIIDGFNNGIPPDIMGHYSNLQMLTSAENHKKSGITPKAQLNSIVALYGNTYDSKYSERQHVGCNKFWEITDILNNTTIITDSLVTWCTVNKCNQYTIRWGARYAKLVYKQYTIKIVNQP